MVVYEVYLRDARVRRHCRALVAAGHTVEVLCVDDGRSRRAAITDGIRLTPLVRDKYRGASQRRYLAAYAGFTLRAFGAVLRRVARRDVDLLYVNNPPDALVYAAWPARVRRIPIILDVHDMTSDLYGAKFGRDGTRAARIVRAVEERSYRFADGLATMSDRYRDRIRAVVGPRPPVASVWNVPDGPGWLDAGAARVEMSSGEGPLRLGHHGTIVERFGIDLGVRAVAQLRAKGRDVRLRILGDGDFADELERIIAQVDRDGAVTFDRRTFDHDDLVAFAGEIDVGIAPYRPSAFAANGLPTKMLEYLALGVPVIVTGTDMVRELMAGAVRVIDGGSVEELADAISDLADPERRADYRRSGLERARTFGWPRQQAALLELVHEVGRAQG